MARALIITIIAVIILCLSLADSVSAHPSWGIVVDRNNQIYFSDLETIWKIDAQGKLTVFRAGVSGRHTHELNIDEAGNLYGEDVTYEPSTQRWQVALWKMTPAGGFAYVLSPTYAPPNGTSIWKDRSGNTYLVALSNNETLVLKRAPNGNVTTLVGSQKAASEYRQVILSSVGGMAFTAEGALYLTDNSNIRKVTPEGVATLAARNIAIENRAESPMPDSAITRLFGIAVNAQGDALVADYGNRRVIKITSGGAISTVARAERPWAPTGVALKDDNLYILEFGFKPPSTYTPRVRRLSPDGRITLLATTEENGNPPGDGSPSGGASEGSAEPGPRVPYVLLGVGAGVLALTIFLWQVRRRISSHQH